MCSLSYNYALAFVKGLHQATTLATGIDAILFWPCTSRHLGVISQDNIGAFSNKKCAGLLGVGYHSWNKWTGNRCLVLSSRIPQDAP